MANGKKVAKGKSKIKIAIKDAPAMKLLTEDELEQELAQRRGGYPW